MTTEVDIVNMALSEIGAQTLITSLADDTPAGQQATLYYARMRQKLLRTAPWGFARKTIELTELGTLAADPPTSPYPWLFKYDYPDDCMKFNYVLPPPFPVAGDDAPDVSSGLIVPWCAPDRAWRFLVASDADVDNLQFRVLLSNVQAALGVYIVDVVNPDAWEPLFTDALVMLLAYKFVIPLSGNVAMKETYYKLTEAAILQARAQDGNESVTTADPITDWIAVRGTPAPSYTLGGAGVSGLGNWWGGYDTNWSM